MTLTDGRDFDVSEITFDPSTYHWTITDTGEDITWLLTNAGRRQFPEFDNTVWNTILYEKSYADSHGGKYPDQVGSTSTIVNFGNQIYNDPLGAPIDQFSKVLSNTGKDIARHPFVFGGIGITAIAIIAGLFLISRR